MANIRVTPAVWVYISGQISSLNQSFVVALIALKVGGWEDAW